MYFTFYFLTHPLHDLKLAADIFNNMHKEVGKTVSMFNILCDVFLKGAFPYLTKCN